MDFRAVWELVVLSLLVGLLALVATAAVARGWLRAEEKKGSQPVGTWGRGGQGRHGDLAAAAEAGALGLQFFQRRGAAPPGWSHPGFR